MHNQDTHTDASESSSIEQWDGIGPAEVSTLVRTATLEQTQQMRNVVVYGYNLPGVHTRWIGIERKPPGDEIRKDKIKLWTLLYIVDGQGTLAHANTPNTPQTIEPGMVVWSSPETPTIQHVTGDKPMRGFVARLFGTDMPERFSKAFSASYGCRRVDQPQLIESIFAELLLEAQRRHLHRDENCAQLTSILLNRITTHLQLSGSFAGEARLYFQKARAFIDANYATIHNSVEIAEHCKLTRQYIGRIFKEFAGVPPHQYLSNQRMYHAREMLMTTDLPISEIGQRVGYEDASLFTRNFRKIEGQSPRDFRKQFRVHHGF